MRRDILDYAIAMLMGFGVGAYAGGRLAEYEVNAVSAYMIDVNGDGIKDIITRSPTRRRVILIGQKDGTFERLNVMTKEQKESIDVMVRDIEAKAK